MAKARLKLVSGRLSISRLKYVVIAKANRRQSLDKGRRGSENTASAIPAHAIEVDSVQSEQHRLPKEQVLTQEISRKGSKGERPIDIVDLEEGGNLYDVAERVHWNREVILTTFNKGGSAQAMNLAKNLQSLGLHHYLLIAGDATTCERIKRVDSGVTCVFTSYLEKDERLPRYRVHNDAGQVPFRLWWARFFYMERLLKEGYNVMYVDVDVLFRSDPYPYFKREFGDYNLFVQRERPAFPGLNIGIVYCQNCFLGSGGWWVVNESLRRRDEILSSDPPIRNDWGAVASGPKNILWDQHIFNDVVETAAGGFDSRRRSFSLLRRKEERLHWMRNQGYQTVPWRRESSVKPSHLVHGNVRHEYAWHELLPLDERPSSARSTLIGPPGWFFGGWSGVIAAAEDQGWWSWWNVDPPPVILAHFVGALNKIAAMKAYGWWHGEAQKVLWSLSEGEALTSSEFSIILDVDNLTYSSKAEMEADYPNVLRKLLKWALATKRQPVFPALDCFSSLVGRDRKAWRNLRDRSTVIVGNCGDERACCYSLRYTCPRFGWLHVEHRRKFAGAKREYATASEAARLSSEGKRGLGENASVLVLQVESGNASALPDIQLSEEARKEFSTIARECHIH